MFQRSRTARCISASDVPGSRGLRRSKAVLRSQCLRLQYSQLLGWGYRTKAHFLNKASNAERGLSEVLPVELTLILFGVKKSQKFPFSRSVTHSACGSRHLLCACGS